MYVIQRCTDGMLFCLDDYLIDSFSKDVNEHTLTYRTLEVASQVLEELRTETDLGEVLADCVATWKAEN